MPDVEEWEDSEMYTLTWDSPFSDKRAKQMFRSKKFADEAAALLRSRGRMNVKVEKWVKPPKSSGRYGPYKKKDNADDKQGELEAAGYIVKQKKTASGIYVYYRRLYL